MKKRLFWIGFWLFIAFGLLVGLDNLIFQPAMPGGTIGLWTLGSVAALLAKIKRAMSRNRELSRK